MLQMNGFRVIAFFVALVPTLTLSACGSTATTTPDKSLHVGDAGHTSNSVTKSQQAEVAGKGKAVMGFDLDGSTHRFIKNDSGGVQQVVADDAGDTTTIAAIRAHVSGVAEAFSRGDFSSPIAIHGEAMPGLSVLRSAGPKLTVTHRELPNGSEVTYRSTDPAVINAISIWFDAQLGDHAQHAVSR
jgi:hypothetical protein